LKAGPLTALDIHHERHGPSQLSRHGLAAFDVRFRRKTWCLL